MRKSNLNYIQIMQISKITFYNKSKHVICKATAILLKVIKLNAQSSHFYLIFCTLIIYIILKVSVRIKHVYSLITEFFRNLEIRIKKYSQVMK
jgi:uncharacterized membrane protein